MSPTASNHDRNATRNSSSKRKKSKKRSTAADDDTPKAFKRLMAYAATGKIPSGLDDPKPKSTSNDNGNNKKRKRSDFNTSGASTSTNTAEAAPTSALTASSNEPTTKLPLTLLPGEKFSDFSRRVDQAIPVSFKGLQKGEDNPKSRKKKKKPEEELDENDPDKVTEDSYDFDDNGDVLPNHLKPHRHLSQAAKGGKHKNGNNNNSSSKRSPSPFAELRQKRGQLQTSINDVVQAPPTLTAPREKLRSKVKLEVPKSSGSLARREMLEQERMGIVERYRALMAKKSGEL